MSNKTLPRISQLNNKCSPIIPILSETINYTLKWNINIAGTQKNKRALEQETQSSPTGKPKNTMVAGEP